MLPFVPLSSLGGKSGVDFSAETLVVGPYQNLTSSASLLHDQLLAGLVCNSATQISKTTTTGIEINAKNENNSFELWYEFREKPGHQNGKATH